MNLDDLGKFREYDSANMIAEIDNLPNQLQTAWDLGQTFALPAWKDIRQVVIAGMGGSAIGADLLAAYVAPHCKVPIIVHRDYDLPAWANGPHTLVITSSHSGNTEETLSAFESAAANGCRLLGLSTGGKLGHAAQGIGVPFWRFEHRGQPRAAIGYSFSLLLALFARLNLVPDPARELQETIRAMQTQQKSLRAAVPVVNNPAKRMAGQLMGRWITIFGAGVLAPVARRWKGQCSEIAKSWAQFEFLPEANHNTLAGILNPEDLIPRAMIVFLSAPSDHPRNLLRTTLTRKILMVEGLNTDLISAQGESSLANQWTILHFGDYTAYYLAMAYEVDPSPVEAIEGLKVELRGEN